MPGIECVFWICELFMGISQSTRSVPGVWKFLLDHDQHIFDNITVLVILMTMVTAEVGSKDPHTSLFPTFFYKQYPSSV